MISYKDSKEYKPTKLLHVAESDRHYVAEMSAQLGEKVQVLLLECLEAYRTPTAELKLTGAELSFFTTINLLIGFITFATRNSWSKSTPRPLSTSGVASLISAELQKQIEDVQVERDDSQVNVTALRQFAALHALGMLRESAQAVKLVANYLERAVLPVKNDVPKWVTEDIKALEGTVSQANSAIKQQIKLLNDAANAYGWLDHISGFAFGDLATGAKTVGHASKDSESGDLVAMIFQASGQKAGLEITIGEIKDSWQEVAKGWNTVKLD